MTMGLLSTSRFMRTINQAVLNPFRLYEEYMDFKQVVVVPEFLAIFQGEFSKAQFTGWPHRANAYAPPLAYDSSVLEVVQHPAP